MSRLSSLLRRIDGLDPNLAADLNREVEALSSRRAFGLNFERHIPETVELPDRTVRRGDKVRFLPERGQNPRRMDNRVWRVHRIVQGKDGRQAHLVQRKNPGDPAKTACRAVDDLVVVAEFRDPHLSWAGVHRQN